MAEGRSEAGKELREGGRRKRREERRGKGQRVGASESRFWGRDSSPLSLALDEFFFFLQRGPRLPFFPVTKISQV